MSFSRRSVLKGMAVGGITGLAMGGSVRIKRHDTGALTAAAPIAAAAQPVLVLTSEGPAESIFLHGARAASGLQVQMQRVRHDLGFMLDFQRQLGSGRPMRVIGLLDDASAVLVVDMARSGGARVQWLGQHTAEVGFTRHRLLNTDIANGCSRQLSRQLHACGAGFSINEERRRNSRVASRQLAGPSRGVGPSAQWASSIGHLLAALGTPTTLAAPLAPAESTLITGSFVSFSIQA